MERFQCLLRQTADQPITRQQLGAFRADLKWLNVVVGARRSGLSASLLMLIRFTTNRNNSPAIAGSCADEKALLTSEGSSQNQTEETKDMLQYLK